MCSSSGLPALLAAGHPHAVLPISGVTHLGPADVATRVLLLERDFLRRHLFQPHGAGQ